LQKIPRKTPHHSITGDPIMHTVNNSVKAHSLVVTHTTRRSVIAAHASRTSRAASAAGAAADKAGSYLDKPLVVVGSINADLVLSVDRLPQAGETMGAKGMSFFPGGKVSALAAASSAFLPWIGVAHSLHAYQRIRQAWTYMCMHDQSVSNNYNCGVTLYNETAQHAKQVSSVTMCDGCSVSGVPAPLITAPAIACVP
jgi:hypothetical protein